MEPLQHWVAWRSSAALPTAVDQAKIDQKRARQAAQVLLLYDVV
jgi:hypothetical protein